jgi:hypothetical protein
MARSDWVALVTEPAAEYLACTELERFGLRPYLPQVRKRWMPPHANGYIPRRYPLFPRYLLLPIGDANPATIRVARGLRKIRPLLAADNGAVWRAPDRVIQEIQQAELRGEFDELLVQGAAVSLNGTPLAGVAAILERSHANTVELFSPLLGGARITVSAARIVRIR